MKGFVKLTNNGKYLKLVHENTFAGNTFREVSLNEATVFTCTPHLSMSFSDRELFKKATAIEAIEKREVILTNNDVKPEILCYNACYIGNAIYIEDEQGKPVKTSKLVRVFEDLSFETLNTIYKPTFNNALIKESFTQQLKERNLL